MAWGGSVAILAQGSSGAAARPPPGRVRGRLTHGHAPHAALGAPQAEAEQAEAQAQPRRPRRRRRPSRWRRRRTPSSPRRTRRQRRRRDGCDGDRQSSRRRGTPSLRRLCLEKAVDWGCSMHCAGTTTLGAPVVWGGGRPAPLCLRRRSCPERHASGSDGLDRVRGSSRCSRIWRTNVAGARVGIILDGPSRASPPPGGTISPRLK